MRAIHNLLQKSMQPKRWLIASATTRVDHLILDTSTESGRLILDRHFRSNVALILTANEVGDLLILGLLDGGFVVLRPLAEDVLLNGVDTYQDGFRLVPNNFHHPGRSATNKYRAGKCMPGNPPVIPSNSRRGR